MHTPDGTLERGQAPPLYSLPVHTQVLCDGDIVLPQVVSLPNKDQFNNFTNSGVPIKDDFSLPKIANDYAVNIPAACQDSSPDTPQPAYDLKQGWMNGIFGCLRPVLSIIGKGVVENKNNQDDWEIPFDQITDLKFLGSGGQGAVFSGTLNNVQVAVKKVSDLKDTDIRNLRKLNHPNVVKFKGVCTQEPSCYCIVMEFCPYGPLFDLLKKQKNIVTINRVVSWAKQIANGMHYLHSHKIIHRDLKSPNVLIGEGEVIKISDFGTSRTWNGVSEKMTFAGTVAWMAPEAIQELACSEKVDIWSYGVVLWELITCEVPYDGMNQGAIMYSVGSGKLIPPIPSTCPDGFKLIMQMCWKFNPKERPNFKLICNHLEIASVDIFSKYEDKTFFETQESWKQEIRSHIFLFCEKLQKHKIEYQLKEEQLIKRRELELKHIRDIRQVYDRRLEKVNQMLVMLSGKIQQIERQRSCGRPKKMLSRFNTNRRRPGNQSTTPTSPECSLTSPDSPQLIPTKPPDYSRLNTDIATHSTTTQTSITSRKRHHRTNSNSPRNSRCSRSSSSRMSIVVDAETQTDSMDISETDMSPTTSCATTSCASTTVYPQRVILEEFKSSVKDEAANGNCVQLHYMEPHPQPVVQIFTRRDSRTPSPEIFECEDSVNRNIDPQLSSEEDNLETISRKVSAMKIDTIFSPENGNISTNLVDIIRQRSFSETRDDLDSTEDAANEDSVTDEEGEIYNHPLRRRSLARRPIYPGRRSNRFKASLVHFQREPNASDEGNTSDYSVSPSSKSSTLESNPERVRRLSNLSNKRTSDSLGRSSDSESEDNLTIATQVAFTLNKTENVV
ncbi:mitogen-activated protein kinase kinase kinase 13-A isoform X3 [Diabrotica virgifera virgifera]|uniref:Mitogen-activated protein kinase kinase kinase n=1 Tax=Diabrotica virgifera virgifera TaxID=50390 RepID=A0A6P7GVA0_DIAVI|nr:mitogen-activated protein kinase kinase kinase 13-A isoform X3 [Diabrotica virgifera virgifera]